MGRYLGMMFGIGAAGLSDATTLFYLKDNWLFFAGAVTFAMPAGKWLEKKTWVYEILLCAVFAVCIIYIIKGNYSPRICFISHFLPQRKCLIRGMCLIDHDYLTSN